ncbi:MAG: hypothetical protein QW348_00320 [Ignisphaera sp.]
MNRYSYVVSNWFNWIVKVDLDVPAILEVGSIATINASVTVVEKGLGEFLSITVISIILGKMSTSDYVGMLSRAGEKASISLNIPIVIDISLKPGATIPSALQLVMQGYIEFDNGSRRQVSFSQNIPVMLFVPPSPVIAFVNSINIDSGVIVQVTINNFDIQPIYKVYATVFSNSSILKTQYSDSIPGNSSVTFSFPAYLDPGIHTVYVNVSYITSYGMSRSFVVATRIVIPLKPRISIQANATNIVYGQSILINGCIDPKARLGIVLEYSLNGFEWNNISSVESNENGCFYYTWKPDRALGTAYVRARSIPTELYKEAISNVIAVSISKIVPIIKLSTNSTTLYVGDPYPTMLVTVNPPTPIPITIMYREPGSTTWAVYTSAKTDERGRAVIPPLQFFSKPGTYTFKALASETNTTASAESSEINVVVRQIQQTNTVQNQISQQSQQNPWLLSKENAVRIGIVLALSIAIALLLLATGRRKLSS